LFGFDESWKELGKYKTGKVVKICFVLVCLFSLIFFIYSLINEFVDNLMLSLLILIMGFFILFEINFLKFKLVKHKVIKDE